MEGCMEDHVTTRPPEIWASNYERAKRPHGQMPADHVLKMLKRGPNATAR